ncbi:MAG: hypothetical protein R6X33_03870 [Candidatus Brocadiia bacterium]
MHQPLEGKDGRTLTIEGWQEECDWADMTAPEGPGIDARRAELLVNDSETMETISLEGEYRDLDGRPVGPTLVLEPFTSRLLIRADQD